jgi:Domain of unknown function (DUF5671)
MAQEHARSLQEFVEASKARGASDEFLAAFLVRRGWPADDVYGAIGNYWERVTGLTVPVRTGRGESARDAFLYLLAFSTLGTWATALGSMLFELINHWVPDAVSTNNVYDLRSSVTWQMASVAVAFPIYLLVMRTIFREAASQPERLVSGVRKWLTYIALWITAVTMVCDLIWFLNYFLKGELTERFVLKAAAVMLIAGAIFVYYISSLRWDRNTDVGRERTRNLVFGAGASVTVVAAFCLGLGVAGTPARQRHLEADQKRVQNLHQIVMAMWTWHRQHGAIPARLTDLGIESARLKDPETGQLYEYQRKSDTLYDLCAQFAADEPPSANGTYFASPFWRHGAGRTCFALDASQSEGF